MARQFDAELSALNEKLFDMARPVEESVDLAVKSLRERNEALAQEVFTREGRVNLLEIEIDEHCIEEVRRQAAAKADAK